MMNVQEHLFGDQSLCQPHTPLLGHPRPHPRPLRLPLQLSRALRPLQGARWSWKQTSEQAYRRCLL